MFGYINHLILVALLIAETITMNAEERLTIDILAEDRYNSLLRPPVGLENRVDVHFDLILNQLIGVNEREQYVVTKVWLPQVWVDSRLAWNPNEYDNITKLQLPSSKIWLPDIVLYNTADGEYESSLQSNAVVLNNGKVSWMPPAIYKSACSMEVSDFPFDKQNCSMIFRSWTYTRRDIDLHLTGTKANLNDFSPSGEWDIIDIPGSKTDFEGSDSHQELTFNLIMRRKPLFYAVNLIIPCIFITFLAILVFYTPSDCGEKMTLCISVLLALTVFLLLLSKMVPPTSLDVPLIGKYLMFTMVLVTFSIITSVCVLNVHHRQASTHDMPVWIQICLLKILPAILLMQRPADTKPRKNKKTIFGCCGLECLSAWTSIITDHRNKSSTGERETKYYVAEDGMLANGSLDPRFAIHLAEVSGSKHVKRRNGTKQTALPPEFQQADKCLEFITKQVKSKDAAERVSEEWEFAAMVIDRLFFVTFIVVFVTGTIHIFLQPFV